MSNAKVSLVDLLFGQFYRLSIFLSSVSLGAQKNSFTKSTHHFISYCIIDGFIANIWNLSGYLTIWKSKQITMLPVEIPTKYPRKLIECFKGGILQISRDYVRKILFLDKFVSMQTLLTHTCAQNHSFCSCSLTFCENESMFIQMNWKNLKRW